MNGLRTLYSFVQEANRLSRDEFLSKYRVPVLVIDPFVALDDTGFKTLAKMEEEASGPGTSPTVALVSKRPGANAFAHMITIGRASNNDIEIKSEGVSKFHAYIRHQPGGEAQLTDAGSTNGTFIQGEALAERGTASVAPKDRLTLGGIKATYHSPQTFYEYLLGVITDPSMV